MFYPRENTVWYSKSPLLPRHTGQPLSPFMSSLEEGRSPRAGEKGTWHCQPKYSSSWHTASKVRKKGSNAACSLSMSGCLQLRVLLSHTGVLDSSWWIRDYCIRFFNHPVNPWWPSASTALLRKDFHILTMYVISCNYFTPFTPLSFAFQIYCILLKLDNQTCMQVLSLWYSLNFYNVIIIFIGLLFLTFLLILNVLETNK